MSFPKNEVRFEGNVVADPETKFSAKGTTVLKFRMAHNVSRKNESGEYEDTPIFFGVTAFGKEAEDVGAVLSKGQRVLVQGRLDPPRTYENKSGDAQVGLDIIADSVHLVTRVPRAGAGSENGTAPAPVAAGKPRGKAAKDEDLSDLPF